MKTPLDVDFSIYCNVCPSYRFAYYCWMAAVINAEKIHWYKRACLPTNIERPLY